MIEKIEEIYEKSIPHSAFLDKKSIIYCMNQSYMLGSKEVFEWLSKMDYLSDNVKYITDEWNNQHK